MEILGLRAGWVQGQELSSHCMPSCIAAGCNYRTCLKSNGNTHPPKKKKKKGAAGDNDVYCTLWSLSTPSFPFWNTFCVWTVSMIGRVPYIVVLYNKHSLRDKWLADGPLLSEQIIPWFLLSIYFFLFFLPENNAFRKKGEPTQICSQTPFKNSFNERKHVGIMEDYANKDSVMFTRVGCVVPSLLSEVGE